MNTQQKLNKVENINLTSPRLFKLAFKKHCADRRVPQSWLLVDLMKKVIPIETINYVREQENLRNK